MRAGGATALDVEPVVTGRRQACPRIEPGDERCVGAALGQLRLQGSPADEARAFMSSVHGAMLAARGFGDAATFAALARLAIARVSAAS